jgi:hypothetical protein
VCTLANLVKGGAGSFLGILFHFSFYFIHCVCACGRSPVSQLHWRHPNVRCMPCGWVYMLMQVSISVSSFWAIQGIGRTPEQPPQETYACTEGMTPTSKTGLNLVNVCVALPPRHHVFSVCAIKRLHRKMSCEMLSCAARMRGLFCHSGGEKTK